MKQSLAILFIFISLSANGQTPPLRDEIIVTASAIPEKVESTPAAVSVVTRAEIDERAARDVADVLREVPGLTLSRSGSPGRATSLFTRGGNSTHTLVLWNGIEINNPYFAGHDWGRFSTLGVEQIEVVRGPYSALYGSDAVSGVVNVLTAPSRSELRAVAEAGGHGLRNGQVVLSSVRGKNAFSASIEQRQDDGFTTNDDFDQRSANLLWRWAATDHLTIGLTGRFTSYELGIPLNLDAAGSALVPAPNRRMEGNERQLAIPFAQVLGNFSWELTLAESRRDDDFDDPDDPFGYVSAATESTARRARLVTRTNTAIGTIVAGAEYERAVVDDKSNFGVNLSGNERTERSFFIEDRYSREVGPASRLELSAGVRRDDFDQFGDVTSPRVAAAWISGSHKFRAAYGQSFRAPSIGELFFPFSGNRDLRPEHGRSIEAGFDKAFGGDGLASITLFRSRYRDLIVFDNRTFTFANIGRAASNGIEVALERRITSALRTAASYTWLATEQDESGDPLLRRPRHSGSIFVGYRAGRVETNAVLLHTGRRDDIQPVFPFSRVDSRAYTTVDVNVQLHLTRLTPYLKVENLTDTDYEEVAGYRSPSRRVVVGLRYLR